MSNIYWDTMLFVYWLEDNPAYAARVEVIRRKMRERGDMLCTSVFTLAEVLTAAYKQNAQSVADQVKQEFRAPAMELLPFTSETADQYARIRAQGRVAPADAIHLASAATRGVDLFLTSDRRLHGLVIPGIHFVAGLDVNLF